MKNNILNDKLYSYDSHKNYLVGAGLLVGFSSALISGAHMKEHKDLSNIPSPLKELVAENKMFNYSNSANGEATIKKDVAVPLATQNNKEYIYLSDIPYMANISSTAYDKIRLNQDLSGNPITVLVNGKKQAFLKGVFAHANATVAYDLRSYDYDYFTAYLGVNVTAGSNGNGVRFEIHTSEDGINWTLKERVKNNATFKGNTDAYFIKYPIKDVNYFKIVVQDNGKNNTSDHSVFANAKLVKEGYEESETAYKADYIKTLNEYDNLIKNFKGDTLTRDQELILLQRNYVKNVGYDILQLYANPESEYADTIKWLMTDLDNLKLYIMGGKPAGSYIESIKVLSRLRKYESDWKSTEVSKYGNVKGNVYKTMAFALSLTHSTKVALWMSPDNPYNGSDAVTRYEIFKKLYSEDKLIVSAKLDITKWFENYTVEEMRFVMNNIIDDESILWLHDYTQSFIDKNNGATNYLTPHPYISYVWPDYNKEFFHDPARKDYWDEKFGGIFSKYGVHYSTSTQKAYKMWMNFRNEFGTGSVCGGISKSGSNIRTSHGIPATVIGQPGHAALLYYTQDAQGRGYWNIDNDVSGWTKSEKGERMLLGWGNDRSYIKGYNVGFMPMAQEAINRFDEYQKSVEFRMIAESYGNDYQKREEYLWKSIDALDFDLDTWHELVELYKSDSSKTEEDYFNLAKKMCEHLMEFPLAYYNLMNQIQPKLTSNLYKFKFTVLLTDTLYTSKAYTGTKVYQPSLTRTLASYLLGQVDTSLANFSFDGENAGKIVLSSKFDNSGIRWDYSIDGKQTWKEVAFTAEEAHALQLTESEIDSITSENDIYIHIVGVNYSEENLYKIDILDSVGLPTNLYANDLENKIFGTDETLEWRYNDQGVWNKFSDQEPDLIGNKSITVRVAATGNRLPSTKLTYTFTKDSEDLKKKYIPIEHLSISDYSSQSVDTKRPYYAPNAIDGNGTTLWHTDFAVNVLQQPVKPYLTIELDEARNVSGLEFIQIKYPGRPNDPDQIKNARVYVSTNGTDWAQAGSIENCSTYGSLYKIEFEQSVYGKFVKLEMDTYNMFASVAMINIYESTEESLAASFSLDGKNANKLILHTEKVDFDWSYSVDGGASWTNASGSEHLLSNKEIDALNIENGIIVRRNGTDTTYVIHITKADAPTRALLNDKENRLIAVTNADNWEWKIVGQDEWKSYIENEPVVKGANTLLVRTKAIGTTLASDPIEYIFAEDTDTPERQYIPIKHLSIHSVSSQATAQGRYATNIIDGNPNTNWHSNWDGKDTTKELVIKLDEPKFISSLEYVPLAGGNGKPLKMAILVSMDGVNYTEVAETDWTYKNTADAAVRTIDFESTKAHYIKLVGRKTSSVSSSKSFMAGTMINLYEDTTKVEKVDQNVELKYSINTLTNQDVVVTLVSDKNIRVINNDESNEYTFTENGTFEFEYTDASGKTKTILAIVDWIDKVAPTADIEYSATSLTNEDVVVTLKPSKKVTITNNDGLDTYTFTENGEFTFEFIDEAGNKGSATAAVSCINKNAPEGIVVYNINSLTNKDVTATLIIDDGLTITNNGGSNKYVFANNGEFTFEFVDAAGNKGLAIATVNWIDKGVPEVIVSYSTKTITNKDVTVRITANEDITILNNNGSAAYTFKENGEFTFEYTDKAGNKGSTTTKVDWIDKTAPSATVSYSTEVATSGEVLAVLIPSEKITITNNGGSTNYLFTENGEFTFEFEDEAGNKGSATATVNWIDKNAPKGMVVYSTYDRTNEDVVVTLIVDEGVTITNNGGSNKYTFTENGTFVFEYVGKNGLVGSTVVTVNWIDKEVAKGTISYSETSLTNEDVIVKLTTDKEVTILNNGGSDEYRFTKNGEFTFEFIDEAGNKGSATAKVDWIDKVAPIVNVSYSIKTITNGDVIVTITADKDITILNNDGLHKYVFTDNGEFTFEYVDKAGNTGSVTAQVDWIDKTIPKGTISYDIKTLTNKDVVVTLTTDEGVTIKNNNGSNKYTFTKNGSFIFQFVDAAGNVGTAVAIVDWIDKVAPTGRVEYDITDKTNKEVTATLYTDEEVTIISNYGNPTYVFTTNGEMVFEFIDKAGNKGSIVAKVDWISDDVNEPIIPDTPIVPDVPSIPDKPSISEKPVTPSKPSTDLPVSSEDKNKPSQSTEVINKPNTSSTPAQTTTSTTEKTTSEVTSTKNTEPVLDVKEKDDSTRLYVLWTIFVGLLLVLLYEVKKRFGKRN